MKAGRSNKLYNYLVNQFGISKEMVLEYVTERLDELVSKHLKSKIDSNHIENMILDKVTKIVTGGIPRTGKMDWWIKDDFDEYLKKTIKQVIKEKFDEEYTLEVKIVQKDARIVHKV